MGIHGKVIKKGNGFDNILKSFLTLHKQNVEIGYFEEQGVHESSKMTYPQLMNFHEYGDAEGKVPPRPVFHIVAYSDTNDPKNNTSIIKGVRNFSKLSQTKNANKNAELLLNMIGEVYKNAITDVFGKSPPLEKNNDAYAATKPNGNQPLILTGDLKNHVAIKTSITKEVI